MPRYVINRKFDVTEGEMPEIGRRSRQIIESEFPNVVWIHSHVAIEDDGNVRTFCLYEAPDLDAINAALADARGAHHRRGFRGRR